MPRRGMTNEPNLPRFSAGNEDRDERHGPATGSRLPRRFARRNDTSGHEAAHVKRSQSERTRRPRLGIADSHHASASNEANLDAGAAAIGDCELGICTMRTCQTKPISPFLVQKRGWGEKTKPIRRAGCVGKGSVVCRGLASCRVWGDVVWWRVMLRCTRMSR